jgi:two-component system response regulator AtoC
LRVGGLKSRAIDVRYVSATNRDLDAAVARGLFRQDLFFRLNGISLSIPPLRERVDEIDELVRFFIAHACREGGLACAVEVTWEARELLRRYSWPGNIRELRNAIERAVLLSSDGRIRPEDLSLEKTSKMPAVAQHPRAASAPLDDADVLRQELEAAERRRRHRDHGRRPPALQPRGSTLGPDDRPRTRPRGAGVADPALPRGGQPRHRALAR